MSKYNRRNDSNELSIIKDFRKAGFYVLDKHNDLLVYSGLNVNHVEIKSSNPFNKNGTLRAGFIKNSQYELLCHANDGYKIIWNSESMIRYLTTSYPATQCGLIVPSDFRMNFIKWLSPKELHRLRTSDKTKGWFSL